MKLSKLLLTVAISCSPALLSAQAIESPITRAMMQVYDQVIDENPRDYETLLRRGNEYYNRNIYFKALDDVNNALRYIPSDDKDTRFRALMLRANIYTMSHRDAEALNDLNEALAIEPGNFVATFLRGKAEYELGQYGKAQDDFAQMLRINPRSQDAMFGLAKVSVKQNNFGVATDYANRAVELSPNVSDVYMQRGEVNELAKNSNGAVADYITAISTDSENTGHALRRLVKLSDSNYGVVMAGLSDAIHKAPRTGMFYYIRAMIAQGHGHYQAAIADYDKIIKDKLYSYGGLNASLAECYAALGKYDTALLNIDYAITSTDDNADYYVMKSRIERALGNNEEALKAADKAIEKAPDLNEALQAKALALVGLEKYQEASVLLSEAILNDSTDPYLLMLRGWILDQYRNQPDVAKTCYERVLEMDFDFDRVDSFKGFAYLFLGREQEADRWMDTILEHAEDNDGQISYYAACYYAQKGAKDLAFRHMTTALEKGYANYYNWTKNNDARINVAPLRDNARFKQLMEKHAALFKLK